MLLAAVAYLDFLSSEKEKKKKKWFDDKLRLDYRIERRFFGQLSRHCKDTSSSYKLYPRERRFDLTIVLIKVFLGVYTLSTGYKQYSIFR